VGETSRMATCSGAGEPWIALRSHVRNAANSWRCPTAACWANVESAPAANTDSHSRPLRSPFSFKSLDAPSMWSPRREMPPTFSIPLLRLLRGMRADRRLLLLVLLPSLDRRFPGLQPLRWPSHLLPQLPHRRCPEWLLHHRSPGNGRLKCRFPPPKAWRRGGLGVDVVNRLSVAPEAGSWPRC
jgi:hypothetical protein